MPKIPDGFEAYGQSPQFDQNTVPDSLKSEHTTKQGVYGKLNIEYGEITYCVTEPGHEAEFKLNPDTPGIIEPTHKHHIDPHGDVSFHIEFYKQSVK